MKKDDDNLFEKLNEKFNEIFGSLDSGDDGDALPDPSDFDDPDSTVVLHDENGNAVSFEFLDLIEYEGEEYVVLLPKDDSEDAGEVVILKLEETDSEDEESYTSVEDEKTLRAVFSIFKEKFKNEFNFLG